MALFSLRTAALTPATSDAPIPELPNAELVTLRVRLIAWESSGHCDDSDGHVRAALSRARDSRLYFPGVEIPAPLAIHAATHMTDLIEP